MAARRIFAALGMVTVIAVGTGSGVGPAGAAACYMGSWNLNDSSVTRTIRTPYGHLTVAPQPGGAIALDIAASGTWALDVDKSFAASGSGVLGSASGTVSVDATATGTYRENKKGALVFRIRTASGNATFNGTVNGVDLSYSYTVVNSDVQQYLGIKGKAVPTCSAGPHLTLRFRLATLTF